METDWRDKTLALYRELTTPHFGTPLVVWPEAALPDLAHQLTDYLGPLWSEARAANTDLVMGLLHYDQQQDAYYNGVLSLSDQLQWYHKRHLVPFAEYFPEFVRGSMTLLNLRYGSFALRLSASVAWRAKLGMTICYEDGFGAEQLAVLKEATLLVNVTTTLVRRFQRAAATSEISRMRALEAAETWCVPPRWHLCIDQFRRQGHRNTAAFQVRSAAERCSPAPV
jgi:apolipoprotein N-acyltransferase